MCECGCTSNDERYLFPAPGNKVYMLTLSKGCIECDAPSGITIERISKSDIHYQNREDYTDGELTFAKWPYGEGVAIITGMLRHEFVNALKVHIVGTDVGEDGTIDEIGAEILLEEVFEDSQVRPHFPMVRA